MKAALGLVLSLAFASVASADTHKYLCKGLGSAADQILVLNSRTIKVTPRDTSGNDAVSFTAKYDKTYKPHNGDAKIRFRGKDGHFTVDAVVETEMLKGGKEMRNGKLGGFARLSGTQDSYWFADYVCYAAR